ncbi:MAG: hypothetical protein E5299_01685 [Burkholderia gladioli]|nr:MAG: hypothetical protein E5299_01685 [Burkholderia gladioli]
MGYCPECSRSFVQTPPLRKAARTPLKLVSDSILWSLVYQRLREHCWLPQEIGTTLKRTSSDDPSLHVSHETIYNAIYTQPRGELRCELIACLGVVA